MKKIIALALLIASGSVCYYYVVFLPRFEREKSQNQDYEYARNSVKNIVLTEKLEACLKEQEEKYIVKNPFTAEKYAQAVAWDSDKNGGRGVASITKIYEAYRDEKSDTEKKLANAKEQCFQIYKN